MLCENCGQRPATVHQTIVVNGAKQESHLCDSCARESGQVTSGFTFPNLSIQELLSAFLGQAQMGGSAAPKLRPEPTCKNCGLTYSEFANSGLLGCSHCYEQFDEQLGPLIKRIQGSTQHSGKAPKRTGGVLRKRRELSQLRQQLTEAVSRENFEEAADLRDRIKAMEAELQAGGGSVAVE